MTRQPHIRPVRPDAREPLAELLLGTAALTLLFVAAFVLLPVLA